MHEKTKMGVFVFVLSLIFKLTLLNSCLALSEDGMVLLELKSKLNDRRNLLWNWQATDEFPCDWTGISCHADDKRVSFINLPNMHLGGTISPSVGKLSGLQRLALHQNSLHGVIPNEICNCTELRALYLRANYLEGGIPSNIGNLYHLTILDISSNLLTGAIPSSMAGLTRLSQLNLSSNFFSGQIPDFGSLSKFGNNSFLGNVDLCGRQVRKPCRTSMGLPVALPHAVSDDAEAPVRHPFHYGLRIGIASTMGFLFIVLLYFLCTRLRSEKERALKKHTKLKHTDQETRLKLIIFHGDLPYSSLEIVEKLEALGEEDVVGSGGYGTVFRMIMNDRETYAVKRLDCGQEGSDKLFEKELEILGGIKHINLLKIRAYCRLPSSKFLIYDYMPVGSLDEFLHEHVEKERRQDWSYRLRIAIGSARGISYLHHDCCPKMAHSDIKSTNILLDENLQPRVADFGLARLLVNEDSQVTPVVAGTFGYLAPELLQSGRATKKTDVYSFGVVLLELVTGKRPTDPMFVKQGLNVVGWMNILLKENRLEDVVDKRCRDADMETVEAILGIATKCTDADPDKRPTMKQVLSLLEQEVITYDSHSDY